ncbi:hypothetical protein HDE_07622 [Halotydeus destructor]|nr:hypothetical protein HDE_07622 [Halotydeus destructor]
MVKLDVALTRWPDLEARMKDAFAELGQPENTSLEETIGKMVYSDKLWLSKFVFEDLKVQDAFEITHHHSYLFWMCLVVRAANYTTQYAPCDELYNITESFKSTAKCFTFKLREPQNYNYMALQRMTSAPGRESTILMHRHVHRVSNDMTIYFHRQGSYSRHGFSRRLLLTPMGMFDVSYATIETELLSAPFASDCHDYSFSGYFNRGDCFEACVIKQSLAQLGKLAPGPNIFLDEMSNERMIEAGSVHTNVTTGAILFSINSDCGKLCSKPNCKGSYRIPQLLSASEFRFATLTTFAGQIPKVSTTNYPKLVLIEIITDLCSSLGFWIGVSGLTMFDLFWGMYVDRQRRRHRLRIIPSKATQSIIRRAQSMNGTPAVNGHYGYSSYSTVLRNGPRSAFS